jgi:hypothetical protein
VTNDGSTGPLGLDQAEITVLSFVNDGELLILGIAENQEVVLLVREQHRRFVLGHGLDGIAACSDNTRSRRFRGDGAVGAQDGGRLGNLVVLVCYLGLKTKGLLLDFIDRLRERLVHVRNARGGGQYLIAPIYDNLGPVAAALHLYDNVSLGRIPVEQVLDPVEMLLYMAFQGRCDFDVPSGIFKFHISLPLEHWPWEIITSDNGFPLPRSGNVHLIAILGDGSPRKLHPFFAEDLRDLVIGEWVLGVLVLDHLLDLQFEDAR